MTWNGLALFSPLLCLIVCALWIRSYFDGDWYLVERFHRHSVSADQAPAATDFYYCGGLLFGYGHVALTWAPERPHDPKEPVPILQVEQGPMDLTPPLETNPSLLQRLGFFRWDFPPPSWAYAMPLWPFVVCLTIVPALWVRGTLRRRRGGCPVCGYDLRASTDRCPECGTAIQPPCTQATQEPN